MRTALAILILMSSGGLEAREARHLVVPLSPCEGVPDRMWIKMRSSIFNWKDVAHYELREVCHGGRLIVG